ncbi:MAG: diacylglycerol kinase family lipid kinase [Anaerolineae bacterium]|nr:diacylglycerol kinase family lipid kinase [Anaerolineae bacterium]
MRVMVIINPAAGIDRPILGLLNKGFHDAGIEWDARITHKAGDARQLAKQAAKEGWSIIAAHGGDGTVMEVADGLQGTGVPLGILPGGTANVMSVELGIPADLSAAVELLASKDHNITELDLAKAKDMNFMLRVGIGFEANMMKNADQEVKNRFGLLAYAFSAANELRNLTSAHYIIEVDGKKVEADGISCMIANSGNIAIGGLRLSHKVSINDGLLDVIVFSNANLLTLLNVGMAVLTTGDGTISDSVQHWQGKNISVRSQPQQTVSVDGEIVETETVEASVLPHAIKVITPAPAQTNGNASG